MKVAPVLAAALVIYIAIPGSNQGKGKPKPKFCTGKDGNKYKKGESYEDEEACIRYTCKKKGKTFKMKEEKIQCTESEPDLAANMTAIEARMKLLNGSMESMENKMEALQSNVESLQTNVESLQTSVESILGMMTAMQSTSSKHEVNITSNMEAISSNKASIVSNKVDISTNNNGINTNKDTCSAIETTTAKLETCLGDVNSTDCPSSEDGKISVVDAIKGNKEDIEALEKPKFNLVLIAGLNAGGSLATSEITSPGGVCSQGIPPLPVAVEAAQSVYFNNMLMVCGGYGGGQRKKCHQLHDSNSEWTEGPAMNTPRSQFSMTKVGQDLYALGGYNGGDLDSMEKLSESSGEWTLMAQKLTSPRRSHCTVFMEMTRSLVTIGGHGSPLVEEFSIATSTWKELAPLPVAVSGHGCMVLGQTIVVTGGHSVNNGGAFQKKVYTFAGGQWATTGELQQKNYKHSIATLDNKVLVLGGYDEGGYVDTIEEMQQDGSFRIMDWKLKEKRGHSTVTQVPREMFPCL